MMSSAAAPRSAPMSRPVNAVGTARLARGRGGRARAVDVDDLERVGRAAVAVRRAADGEDLVVPGDGAGRQLDLDAERPGRAGRQ